MSPLRATSINKRTRSQGKQLQLQSVVDQLLTVISGVIRIIRVIELSASDNTVSRQYLLIYLICFKYIWRVATAISRSRFINPLHSPPHNKAKLINKSKLLNKKEIGSSKDESSLREMCLVDSVRKNRFYDNKERSNMATGEMATNGRIERARSIGKMLASRSWIGNVAESLPRLERGKDDRSARVDSEEGKRSAEENRDIQRRRKLFERFAVASFTNDRFLSSG